MALSWRLSSARHHMLFKRSVLILCLTSVCTIGADDGGYYDKEREFLLSRHHG